MWHRPANRYYLYIGWGKPILISRNEVEIYGHLYISVKTIKHLKLYFFQADWEDYIPVLDVTYPFKWSLHVY